MRSSAPQTFRCFVHPRPTTVAAGPEIEWSGIRLPTLDGSTVCPDHFACRYDDVAAHWNAMDGMFLEGDGSFAWVGTSDPLRTPWHLEGQLTDAGRSLALVELVGYCQPEQLDQLLRPLGWPACPVIFQLRDVGVYVDEPTFRQYFLLPGSSMG